MGNMGSSIAGAPAEISIEEWVEFEMQVEETYNPLTSQKAQSAK